MNKIYQRLKNSFTKKVLVVSTLTMFSMSLAGCWDLIELNDHAIITAAAIDKGNDGQVEIALEIFIPKNTGGNENGGGGVGQAQSMVTYHTGDNLADALAKLQSELPRTAFWGACKVFIFSEEIVKEGIENQLDFLTRHLRIRESAYAFVSKGAAKNIIEQKSELEHFSSLAIYNITRLGKGLSITFKDMEEMLMDQAQNLVLPLITLKEVKTSQDKVTKFPVFTGAVVFSGDKMVDSMSESATRGLLWFRDELKGYTISFKPEGEDGEISLFPETTTVKLIPTITNDEWKIIVDVQAEGSIVQNETTLTADDPDSLKLIEEAYRKRIETRLNQTIVEAQNAQVDVLLFGKQFHRKHPQEWKKVKDHWEEFFPEVKVEFAVETNIRRQGYISAPVKDEVR